MPDIVETVHLSRSKVLKVVKVASKKVPLDLVLGLNSWPVGFTTSPDITRVTYMHDYKDEVISYAD